MADMRWIEKRRETYYAVVEIPPSIRERLGKQRRIVRTLGTRDVAVARARRWAVVAEIRREIEAARGGSMSGVTAEALGWREAIEGARRGAVPGEAGDEGFVRDLITERAAELAARDKAAAGTFYGLATGTATLLAHYLETWLTEGGARGPFTARTKDDHRRAVADLTVWLTSEALPATVEEITRRVAGRYLSEHLLRSGKAPKTVGKAVSSLSTYWAWLARRGLTDGDARNPWSEQAPQQRTASGAADSKERAFTMAEVGTLLAGCPDQTMADFLRVALLTGMRREEIGRLTVGDVQDDVFTVQRGKTAAARRRVPVHPDLKAIVARRSDGKAASDHLFGDLPGIVNERGERADALGKRFTRMRRSLGIQDGEGRRSRVNLHSCRRFFITEAVNAGQPPHLVSLVVGHTEGRVGMTLGRYWSGADDAALRAVVEAVRLPLQA